MAAANTSAPTATSVERSAAQARVSLERYDDGNGVVLATRSYIALPPLQIVPIQKTRSFEIATTDTATETIAARSVSTYPMMLDKQSGKLVRDGDPNADGFYAALYDNRAILAIADGCNWGIRSYKAARRALEGVSMYLLSHEEEMGDLRHAGHLLLRALCEANRKIVEGVAELWEAGTTTVLVGIVLQVLKEEPAAAATATEQPSAATAAAAGGATEWGFLCGSVGDCKAYVWNKHSATVTDVTLGNRCADTRDPGGRLGPYIGKDPDLRNLRLHYRALSPGDVIILCTDGVYDNFDPIFLGLSPQDLGLSYPTWDKVPDETQESVKESHALRFAQGLIKKQAASTPGAIVDAFVSHAVELTEKTRQFMQSNPDKKQSCDFHAFPGKMDHTTALAFMVGGPVPSPESVAIACSSSVCPTGSPAAPSAAHASSTPPDHKGKKKEKDTPSS